MRTVGHFLCAPKVINMRAENHAPKGKYNATQTTNLICKSALVLAIGGVFCIGIPRLQHLTKDP